MEKYLTYYDTEKYHCVVICKCKILRENEWEMLEVKYNNGIGLTHKENVFDTLEEAQKYCGHSNRIELLEEVA